MEPAPIINIFNFERSLSMCFFDKLIAWRATAVGSIKVKLIGSYAYTNKEFKNSLTMISKNKLGNLSWKSFTNLKNGQKIFESINTGKSISPKIILTP